MVHRGVLALLLQISTGLISASCLPENYTKLSERFENFFLNRLESRLLMTVHYPLPDGEIYNCALVTLDVSPESRPFCSCRLVQSFNRPSCNDRVSELLTTVLKTKIYNALTTKQNG